MRYPDEREGIELPKVTAPFLPPIKEYDPTYTLVLDLDETLIHFVDTMKKENGLKQELVENNLDSFSPKITT